MKISDFGLARDATNDYYVMQSSTNIPVKWLALECLTQSKVRLAGQQNIFFQDKQCFRSGFFSGFGSNFFCLSPDPDRPKIRIRIHYKKRPKTVFFFLLLFSTLNTVLFGQVPPQTNLIGVLDGSGSGFLKSGSGSA